MVLQCAHSSRNCGHNNMENTMSILYKNFATDTDVEVKGFWYTVDYNDDGSPVMFLLARKGKRNKKYSETISRLLAPYSKQIEMDTMQPKVLQSIFLDCFLIAILKGWKNVISPDGDKLEFNAENARKLMKDLPDLYDILDKQSEKASNYHPVDVEEVVKN